jgi:hypothetical protein
MTDLMESTSDVQWSQVTELTSLSSWLAVALKGIRRLERLEANWDGFGSPEIRPQAIRQARHLLTAVEADPAPNPHIAPVPGGGLQAAWVVDDRELEIEFLPDGSVEYLRQWPDGRIESGYLLNEIDQARELIEWAFHT